MKLIIVLSDQSKWSPARIGDFVYSEKHKVHVWNNRELTPEEFNKAITPLLMASKRNRWLSISARVLVGDEPETIKDPAPEKREFLNVETGALVRVPRGVDVPDGPLVDLGDIDPLALLRQAIANGAEIEVPKNEKVPA